MQLISNTSALGLQVWRKPLSDGTSAVVFFHRGVSTVGPLPSPSSAPAQVMHVRLEALGFHPGVQVAVRDLWAKADLGSFNVSFSAKVAVREARIYKFKQIVAPQPTPTPVPDVDVLPLRLFEPSTGAMCLDGSMGGYHARNGSKTQLLISMPVSAKSSPFDSLQFIGAFSHGYAWWHCIRGEVGVGTTNRARQGRRRCLDR
eukprot:COSAG02_NODE_222_length_28382_cov_82.417601_5_plen_202_part_00